MDRCQDNQEVSEVSERLEKSLSIVTDDKMETYNRLISDGKSVAKEGDIRKALDLFKQAYKILQTPKLESRIKKIEELLSQTDLEDEDEDDEFVNVNNSGLMLYRELYDKLYTYQRDGVSFLYELYRDGRKGGVLADDMGLGKTIQVISFLSGMYDNELVKHTLLVMPTSLITNWIKEFSRWTPGMRVKEFHGAGKAERTRCLEKIQRRGGVIITTYTMLINNWQQLASYQGKEFVWDYMILDEAHKIKNSSTKTAKSAYAIPSNNRVLLTGTPVQNNLKEMWTLFDFACQGTLLGTAKTFKTEYENPITRARERDATPGEKVLGSRMSENLMVLIQPYYLRRTKSEVQKKSIGEKQEESDNKDKQVQREQSHSGAVMPKLTRKNDLIVWTYLSAIQEDIYRQFIGLDHVKELLMTTKSPLAELTILKKLCDHPRLLSANAVAKLGLEESPEDGFQSETTETDTNSIANISDETLISESGKLVFLLALLERLREEGHRTLIFAHYRKVLDILERVLGNRGFKVLRLDGTITQITEREKLISRFQTDRSYSVFLLTTQVGGVGITLTAANRVVIYDPSWNPATDAQAVDRAYRIGQTENVVIYRLITCGTVEEKIYRRQVFKDSLIRQNTGDKKNPFRYFSRQELKELFLLEDTRSSSTQLQLQALHSRHRRTDPELDEHIACLHAMHMFGISDHDLMFSLDVNNDEAPENQEEHQYIEGRVQKAQELMRVESELQMQISESVAANTEPAWLRQPPGTDSREKKPRNPKPSPSLPQTNNTFNTSPVVVVLDRSSSGGKNSQQNQSDGVIDLTGDASPQQDSVTGGDPMDKSPEHDSSLLQPVADPNKDGPIRTSQSEADFSAVSPLQNRTGSVLQQSESSFRAERSRGSGAFESMNGNFNLQLDDSDEVLMDPGTEEEEEKLRMNNSEVLMDPGTDEEEEKKLQLNNSEVLMDPGTEEEEEKKLQLNNSEVLMDPGTDEEEEKKLQLNNSEVLMDPGTEEEEKKLLFQLLKNDSFDVSRSLSESLHHRASGVDVSMNDSILTTKKRRAAVIYDSDEDDEEEQLKSPADSSFQVLGASTPKSAPSPRRSRKSVGGNASVVSSRSLLQSIIEDMDSQEEDESDEEGEGGEVSELNSDNDPEPEEVTGKTLNSEEEEEEDAVDKSGEDMKFVLDNEEEEEDNDDDEDLSHSEMKHEDAIGSTHEETSKEEEEENFNPEESSSEPELGSGERMDRCAAESSGEPENYDSLVRRGKEFYSQARLDDALSFFLRAIDLQPGDPEVQFMTIQLYRQLSQR
ncbi:DNA excision repair protein ERCC-6-like isoform X2 [Kryptolebias marmoratus]|uniref:DNA excision repair protein ERCC-6-like isoform X2 n=1 Tax=Kryptolebias marmoratus TaxID=37003 RepID=UPI000D52F28B|nr:DNA excision repair protein ERCC-6-like isoform X2 [Kryptolebias marmoratus]